MIGDVAVQPLPEEMESKKRSLKSASNSKENSIDKDVISPPAKRMKQARLPFKPRASPNELKSSASPSPQLAKKSKPAGSPSPFFSSGKSKHADKKAETPQGKRPGVVKGRKIGFSHDSAIKSSAPPEPEVSSSSEDAKPLEKECDSTVSGDAECTHSSAAAKKTTKAASLDSFIQTTQQPQVSTSDIVELTDADDEMEDEEEEDTSKLKKRSPLKEKEEKDVGPKTNEAVDSQKADGEKEESDTAALNSSVSSLSSADQPSSDEEEEDLDDDDDADKEESDDELDADVKDAGSQEDKMKSVKLEKSKGEASSTQDESVKSGKVSKPPATPKNALKPVKKTPMSAKTIQRLKEQEMKKEKKLKLREEKKRKLEEERELKKRQKVEHKQAKEEEKETLRKQKMEEKKQRQQEKQQKKEKEEQERLEKKKQKEEERSKKQQEIDAKQEEKKKKLEERQKQEDEKKQKEAELLMKKEKQSLMFKSFFKTQAPVPVKKPETKGPFAPFQVKEDMVLAPCRRVESEKVNLAVLDEHFESQSLGSLYLEELKSGDFKPRKGTRTPGPTRPVQDSMDVDAPPTATEEPSTSTTSKKKKQPKQKKPEHLKMKLLQFHENYRPAYYGTWQKTTDTVVARNPFKKDEDVFDYDLDSDEEWEEPGESLSHSEGEDEDGEADSDEEDEDGFFVPHGYLSAGEGGEDDDDTDHLKARQAAKARAWENELKRRCEALRPIIISCLQGACSAEKTCRDERRKLEAYRAMPLVSLPIATSHTRREMLARAGEEKKAHGGGIDGENAAGMQQRLAGGMGNKLKPVPEEAMPDLLHLVHGNMAGIKSLIREFRDHWRRKRHQAYGPSPAPPSEDASPATANPSDGVAASVSPSVTVLDTVTAAGESPSVAPAAGASPSSVSPVPTAGSGGTPSPQNLDHLEHVISKRQLDLKINSIAVREKRPEFKRICWYVHPHVLERYKLKDLPIPSVWVNGVGLRDGQSSPLPPMVDIAARPVGVSVSKPVVTKLGVGAGGGGNLPKVPANGAAPQQHIYIPSVSMPSAFNKVVGASTAAGTMHLPGATPFTAGTPSINYLTPQGSTLLPAQLAPFQVVPLHMQQAINPASFNMSNLLQQAAATSILANMQTNPALCYTAAPGLVPTNLAINPAKTLGAPVPPRAPPTVISQSNNPTLQHLPSPNIKPSLAVPQPATAAKNLALIPDAAPLGNLVSAPSLPSIKKTSPQRLNTVLAKLYQSSSLSPSSVVQEQSKPAPPSKKNVTLAKFFSVKSTKQQETAGKPSEEPTSTPMESD